MASHEELVSQFTDVTGVDAERAWFYLESSAWQLEVAIASFFENNDTAGGNNEIMDIQDRDEYSNESEEMSKPTESATAKKSSKSGSNSRFGTIDSLRNRDSSSDEEEGQAFYAGGSEHSGQQVLGPGKKNDLITDMFKQCQKQSVAGENRPSGVQRPNTFGGTGYKLGQTSNDSQAISGSSASSSGANSGVITLKLWHDGFTINDRKLRPYADPENREFLDAIKRGEIPMELRQEVQDAEIHLDMEDHRHENYTPPKVKVKAFTGKGHKLGSPSPATVGTTSPILPEDQAANEELARSQLNVNPAEPLTTLQIRFADGSNSRTQFNLTHTIGDIRQFVVNMRPQYAARNFVLSTAYPTKELTDETQTIADANLQNSAIMQRLK